MPSARSNRQRHRLWTLGWEGRCKKSQRSASHDSLAAQELSVAIFEDVFAVTQVTVAHSACHASLWMKRRGGDVGEDRAVKGGTDRFRKQGTVLAILHVAVAASPNGAVLCTERPFPHPVVRFVLVDASAAVANDELGARAASVYVTTARQSMAAGDCVSCRYVTARHYMPLAPTERVQFARAVVASSPSVSVGSKGDSKAQQQLTGQTRECRLWSTRTQSPFGRAPRATCA